MPQRLFQDVAGTIPASLPGDPVGLSIRAAGDVNATQGVALAKPTLVRWPANGRRNMLRISALTNAWSPANGLNISPGVAAETDASGVHTSFISNTLSWMQVEAGITYTWTAVAKAGSATHLQLLGSAAAFPALYANFDLASGEVSATGGGASASVVDAGGGWWKCSISMTATASGAFSPVFGLINNGASSGRAPSYTGAGRTLEISAMQWEAGGTATPVQTVTTPHNITEPGVPDKWHLYNDGGDSLSTVLPAGTYGTAHLIADGSYAFGAMVSDGVTPITTIPNDRQVDCIYRLGPFTAEEQAQILAYWQREYPL